jgi:hypothetical protein
MEFNDFKDSQTLYSTYKTKLYPQSVIRITIVETFEISECSSAQI